MNYIVHRDGEPKSVVLLGMTYRLTIDGIAGVMQAAIREKHLKSWPAIGSVTLKDFRRGIRVMIKVARQGTTPVTISSCDAYHALVVCAYVSSLFTRMTPSLKSMLRETVMIFAECSAVTLRVAYLPPFDALAIEVKKMPVVVRHYRAIEARASLALEPYPISLTDALELLEAIKCIRTIKIELLRQALEKATAGIREILTEMET
jgi:hypothetical protein